MPDISDLGAWDKILLTGSRFLDMHARLAATFSDTVYEFVFTHHQKLYLIDIENPDATAFVIGSNLNEDYWDDGMHLAHNMNRYPYRAWHDSGLEVKGPVLYDIARTFQEGWSLLATQEVLPKWLYVKAWHAQKKGVQLGHNPSAGYEFPLPPQIAKEVPQWQVKLPGSPDYYKPHVDANDKHVETQFTRTFVQKGAPRDLSIRRVLYRAVKQVRPGGVIYIENQYFRDLILMRHIMELGKRYSYLRFNDRPKIIILTNDPSLNSSEKAAAVAPTFEAYAMLEDCGLPFHYCNLQTKHWPAYEYAGARY